jgi:high-affinity Fe2+/Pb2+ permease
METWTIAPLVILIILIVLFVMMRRRGVLDNLCGFIYFSSYFVY